MIHQLFHRIGILPERRAEYDDAKLRTLSAARREAMDRYAKADKGSRQEAHRALRRACDALMRAGG